MEMVAAPPTSGEVKEARKLIKILEPYAKSGKSLRLQVGREQSEIIELPASALSLLMDVLEGMAAGRGIMLIPYKAELTTVQAAGILNVSRPFLIKLLEEGAIPYRMVGKHRRVRMEDVLAYKAQIDEERERVLDQLVAEAQALDMGYEA